VYNEPVSLKFVGANDDEMYCGPLNVLLPVVAKLFEPTIPPVVVTAPDELTDIRVVEPLTNVMLPLASCFIILVRLDAD
jgi:hypothetical protein